MKHCLAFEGAGRRNKTSDAMVLLTFKKRSSTYTMPEWLRDGADDGVWEYDPSILHKHGSVARLDVTLRNETDTPSVRLLRIGHVLEVHGKRVDIINNPFNDVRIELAPGQEIPATYFWVENPEECVTDPNCEPLFIKPTQSVEDEESELPLQLGDGS